MMNEGMLEAKYVVRRPGSWWRFGIAACIAIALSIGAAGCGSESGGSDTGQPQDDNSDTDLTWGKFDMAGFPSGLYTNPLGMSNQPKGTLLTLNLKPDKTFTREMVAGGSCPPGAYCIMPAGATGPKKDTGTYKFSYSGSKTYVRLMRNGTVLTKYEYKMPASNDLSLRAINTSTWTDLVRDPSKSVCLRDDDCMPGESCQGGRSCPKGAYCILPNVEATCKPIPCDPACQPWEECRQSNSQCPAGAYCILPPMPQDRCVPKTCTQDSDCGDGAFCEVTDNCPQGAYCVLPVVRGVCKPKPPSGGCPEGAYCILPAPGCPPDAYCILPPQAANHAVPQDSSVWRSMVEQQLIG